jgi:hypothetical protein
MIRRKRTRSYLPLGFHTWSFQVNFLVHEIEWAQAELKMADPSTSTGTLYPPAEQLLERRPAAVDRVRGDRGA